MTNPAAATSAAARGTLSQKPSVPDKETARYMPSMYSEPCAKLTMRLTPKISDRPAATKNKELAPRARSRTAAGRRSRSLLAQRADLLIGGLVLRAIRVMPVDHHALIAFPRELADVGAHGRLVVERPPQDLAEGGFHLQPFEGGDQLVGIERAGLPDAVRDRVQGAVADHRA